MINNIIGTLLSIIFVILVIGVSEILKKKGNFTNEATRKFIHIGVAHWWLVAMALIPNVKYAIIPPILFIILNYISYKKSIIKSMERDGAKEDLGTVYFPISLFVLILLTWDGGLLRESSKYLGAIGILVMGYGDGFAAIIGKSYGKNKYNVLSNTKSLEGSMAMLFFSTIVSFVLLLPITGAGYITISIAIVLGMAATLLEALTPLGLDNLSVPILITVLAYYLTSNINNEIVVLLNRGAIGIVISSIMAYAAYGRKSLSMSGALGAIILGSGIFATGGMYSATLMVVFFISSSVLSHFKKSAKKEVAQQFDKTGKRDIVQVFANGGIGLIYSIIYFVTKDPIHLIFIGIAFASANADTWSTELGILNKKKPFSLRTFKKVDKGTSGAISGLGTIAGLLGSMFIAISSVIIILAFRVDTQGFSYQLIFVIISLGGFLGGLIDSILGATVQGIYYSEAIGKETEKRVYEGQTTRLIRGFKIFNNDLINFLSIGISTVLCRYII